MDPKGKRITAVRLSALGDIAMTIPAVKALALTYPDIAVTFITDARFAGLVADTPENLTVVGLPKNKLKGLKAIPAVTKAIRESKPDFVVDMHNVVKTTVPTILFGLAGKKTAVLDKKRRQRKAILEGKINAEPFTQRYLDLFAEIGFPVKEEKIKSSPQKNQSGAIRVGIAPFARYYTKTYPPELTEELIRKLNERGKTEIFLFGGGAAEIEKLTEWGKKYPAVKYISGKSTLAEEIELMHTLDAMVSMDSANMHLASLAGTKVISVWGGTTPSCGFLGWGQSIENAIVAGVDCQPCSIAGTPTCPKGRNLICMTRISPDDIIERIL